MKRLLLSITLAVAALSVSTLLSATATTAADNTPDPGSSYKRTSLQIPFIENIGQADDDVAFYADTFGGAVVVKKHGELELLVPLKKKAGQAVIGEAFVDANIKAITGTSPAVTRVSYFLGNKPEKWFSGIPTYENVSLSGLYDGIDLELKAYANNVEKLFHVDPGADPDSIRIKVSGARSISVTEDGFLELETNDCIVHYSVPIAYQVIDNEKHPVDVAYRVSGNSYGFELGDYDRTRALVIDPLLQATYFGGTGTDVVRELGVAPGGNVYAVGHTDSDLVAFSATADGIDAFVARFNPSLTTLHNVSYIGGSAGEDDKATVVAFHSIASDQFEVYIAGETASPNLPMPSGGADAVFGTGTAGETEGFVARFDSDLLLLGSTYFGGDTATPTVPKADSISGIAIAVDNLYISGTTESADIPGIVLTGNPNASAQDSFGGGSSDAFVASLSFDLSSIIAATYLGAAGADSASGLVIDSAVYVAGNTDSDLFPGAAGNFQATRVAGTVDAFISQLDTSLSGAINSSYYGGNGDENIKSIVNSGAGTGSLAYIAGDTTSTDLRGTTATTDNNSFIAYINKDLAANTDFEAIYVGGDALDELWDMALLKEASTFNIATDTVYITGLTRSASFPNSATAEDEFLTGTEDAFVMRVDATLLDNADMQMTYLGGSESTSEFGYALAVDPVNGVYVGGVTTATDFTGTTGGAIASAAGGTDGFVSRHGFTLQYDAEIRVSLSSIDFGDVFAGDESAEVQVSVSNLDTVNKLIITPPIELSDDINYTLNDLGPATACATVNYQVNPLENCIFTVKFNPQVGSADAYTATVTIRSNDLDEAEKVINLRGTGSTDSDGVPDSEEMGPSGTDPTYDGNGDGIADLTQESAASLHSQNDAFYVTIATSNSNLKLENVATVPLPASLPDNIQAPFGFYSYTVTGLTPGGTATVVFTMNATGVVTLTGDEEPDGFWKHGPQTPGAAHEWYDFVFDATTGTGATVDLNTATLSFVDGLRGDFDLTADGDIEDPGAPIKVKTTTVVPTTIDSGSSGLCFIATAAYGSYMHDDVRVLRDFRDEYLLSNSIGRKFVAAYYEYSPPVANFISESEVRRTATRLLLSPLVYSIKHPYLSLLLIATAGMMIRVYRRRRTV